jgi:hypothetical protein
VRSQSRLGEPLRTCGVFIAYLLISLLTIAHFALPHFGSICACSGSTDSASFMWGLAWWPHALGNGLNPFYTHLVWSPAGGNVAQAAMMPAAAIAMAPITELLGPIASYNLLTVLSPALSGLAAYVLCRRLTGDRGAAFAGGYVYGFSTYELARAIGHLNLAVTFVLPLFVLVVIERAKGSMSRRRYVAAAAALFLTQAGLSTELLADGVGIGVVVIVSARLMTGPSERSQLDRTLAETAIAGLVALVAGAPFFYYAIFYSGAGKIPPSFANVLGIDLLNPFVPTQATAFGGNALANVSRNFSGHYLVEADGYLGIALIGVFAMFLRAEWASCLRARLAAIAALVPLVLSLGAHLYVAGHRTPVPLPFAAFGAVPVLDNLEPSRFSVFVTLPVAVAAAAMWARTDGNIRVTRLLVVIAALLPFPNLLDQLYGTPMNDPPLFRTDAYRAAIPRGATVLALPYAFDDNSMLWQAQTGFWFAMPEGYLRFAVPPPFDADKTVNAFIYNRRPSAAAFRAFVNRYRVSYVLIDPSLRHKRWTTGQVDTDWVAYLEGMGLHASHVGGTVVFSTHR